MARKDDLDAGIEKIRSSGEVTKVMEIVAGAAPVELELLGGRGARKA